MLLEEIYTSMYSEYRKTFMHYLNVMKWASPLISMLSLKKNVIKMVVHPTFVLVTLPINCIYIGELLLVLDMYSPGTDDDTLQDLMMTH